jgi:hypothetical protein
MNKALFQKVLPHLVAVVIFLLVAVIYCKPALEGLVVNQHDITQFKGMIQASEQYRKTHGDYPLWTTSAFSGMPTFQIGGHGSNFLAGYTHLILTLHLPEPIGFFFLACISFYFLCMVLRVSPWVGVLGALAFAYCTYNPVIIVAGHNTKMWAIAYMPALLGSVILIFERRYWTGAALTLLFSACLVAMNHLQIAYYLFLVIGLMTVFFIVRAARQKDARHLLVSLAILASTMAIGVLTNSENLFSTYEFQKRTIRGGPSELTDTTGNSKPGQTGLDKDYAFDYSMDIPEPFVMMVPRIMGGSDLQEMQPEESKAYEVLQTLPPQLQQQLGFSWYWGGIGATSGPPYMSAIICFLAIMALFVLDGKYKWWMATACVLAIMMSWGSYFEDFNTLFYDYLPFYNKFRAPSMILVIPQLLLPALAVLGVQSMVDNPDKKWLMSKFKKGLIAIGAVFVLLLIIYNSFDYIQPREKQVLQQVAQSGQPQLIEAIRQFYDGVKADRETLFKDDLTRSFGFILVAVVLLFLLIRKTINPKMAIAGLALFVLIDLLVVDSRYLNYDLYKLPEENDMAFQKTAADNAILADTSYYRVFNVRNPFADGLTSYYYNSLGGYTAAKLRIYQDLIEHQLSKPQFNMPVLNMLNTKYFIQKDQLGQTQNYQKNDSAYGPAWFVNEIRYVKTADEEMKALDSFDSRHVAIVREDRRSLMPASITPDSSAQIKLVKNDFDVLDYTTQTASPQFAVLSEIYYDAGWKAFIDDKEVPIVRVNYVLRGIPVPAGNHHIQLRFEPQGYLLGHTLTMIFGLVGLALILLVAFLTWNRNRKATQP